MESNKLISYQNGDIELVDKSSLKYSKKSKTDAGAVWAFWSPDPHDTLAKNYFSMNSLPRFRTDPKTQGEKGFYSCKILKNEISTKKKPKKSATAPPPKYNNESFVLSVASKNNEASVSTVSTESIEETVPSQSTVSFVSSQSNEADRTEKGDTEILCEMAVPVSNSNDLYVQQLEITNALTREKRELFVQLDKEKKENRVLRANLKELKGRYATVTEENIKLTEVLKKAAIDNTLAIPKQDQENCGNVPESYQVVSFIPGNRICRLLNLICYNFEANLYKFTFRMMEKS